MLAKAKAAAAAAADAAKKVKESSAMQQATASASGMLGTVKARAEKIPEEDRQKYKDVAITVLTLASACGSTAAGRLCQFT